MIGIGSALPSDFGMLGRLMADNTSLRGKLDTLTAQASSGRIGDSYAHLGKGASVALSLSPQIASLQNWQSNVDLASGRMQVTQTAMSQMQGIASNLLAQLNNLNGLNALQIDTIAADARSAMAQVGNLLDTQIGGVYVFAGLDTANPPVPQPDDITSTGLFTGIQTAVQALASNGAATTAAATLALAVSDTPGVTPFSTYLSTTPARPMVQVGPNQTVPTGILANANAATASMGSVTTGSYSRELLRALATIGSLSSSQANDPGLSALVQNTRQNLTGTISAMATDAGVLGDAQTSLTATKTRLGEMTIALTTQVSSAQDVDMAATLSSLSQVQTQLQASYQMIASLSSLSLVKFLSAG